MGIKRKDGSEIEFVAVGPNRFRLTLNGKPYNVAKEIERKCNAALD